MWRDDDLPELAELAEPLVSLAEKKFADGRRNLQIEVSPFIYCDVLAYEV